MSTFETTELKLKTTPTGGAEAHVSPYYRRLVSAGYKGFLQGTIGGASLYGFLGLAVGGMAALALGPVGLIPSAAAWLLIPACTGYGIFKGAATFGQIGSTAAINAESADLSEQRRYLLDRYYDLPEGPEGDREAKAIQQELKERASEHAAPKHMFHWKTVAVCTAVGAALVLVGLAVSGLLMGSPLAAPPVIEFLHGIGFPLATKLGEVFATSTALASAGALVGAFAGATVGLDRYYIRKWFDHTQDIVHPSSHVDYGLGERHKQVQRLQQAAKEDEKTKQHMAALDAVTPTAALDATPKTMVAAPKPPVASLDKEAPTKPENKVSKATLERRVAELQNLVEV